MKRIKNIATLILFLCLFNFNTQGQVDMYKIDSIHVQEFSEQDHDFISKTKHFIQYDLQGNTVDYLQQRKPNDLWIDKEKELFTYEGNVLCKIESRLGKNSHKGSWDFITNTEFTSTSEGQIMERYFNVNHETYLTKNTYENSRIIKKSSLNNTKEDPNFIEKAYIEYEYNDNDLLTMTRNYSTLKAENNYDEHFHYNSKNKLDSITSIRYSTIKTKTEFQFKEDTLVECKLDRHYLVDDIHEIDYWIKLKYQHGKLIKINFSDVVSSYQLNYHYNNKGSLDSLLYEEIGQVRLKYIFNYRQDISPVIIPYQGTNLEFPYTINILPLEYENFELLKNTRYGSREIFDKTGLFFPKRLKNYTQFIWDDVQGWTKQKRVLYFYSIL